MVATFNTMSADGFIAAADGSEDFIPDEAWGWFLSALKDFDALVLGRKSYDAIQSYPDSMSGGLDVLPIRRFVISSDTSFRPKSGFTVLRTLREIPSLAARVLISGGPTLNTAAYRAGIVDEIRLNVLPVRVGSGIPVFSEPVDLGRPRSAKELPGRREEVYQVVKDR